MAYKVEVCIEIACCDCCVCKVAVLGFCKERVILVSAFSTISASVRITDEFDVSFLAAVGLEDITFSNEGVYCETSLLAFGPLLEDHFVLSLSESLCQYNDCILCCNEEFAVCLRSHRLVNPEVEPAVLCIRTFHC